MTVLDKIAALRAAMEAEGADGVYVPSSDPHMTEYLPCVAVGLYRFGGNAVCDTGSRRVVDGRTLFHPGGAAAGGQRNHADAHGPARRAHRGGMAGGQDARRRNAGTGRRLHQCVRGGIAGKSAGGKKSCPA